MLTQLLLQSGLTVPAAKQKCPLNLLRRLKFGHPTQPFETSRGSVAVVKKSIWFISKYASPPHSFGGQRGVSLMGQFAKNGHNVALVTSTSNHFAVFRADEWVSVEAGFRKAVFDGVTMLTHRTASYRKTISVKRALSWIHFEWGLLRLPTRHLQAPTHIIVSSLSLVTVISAYRLSRKFNAKLIFEVRDIWPLTLELEFGLSKRNWVIKTLSRVEKFGYTRADVVIGTMPNLIEHVVEKAGQAPRVETVPLGIDEDLAELTQTYEPPTKSGKNIVIGYSGSIGCTNSVEVLLLAAKQLGPDQGISFQIWGGGDLLENFREQFSDQPHIRFHGHTAREMLFSQLSRTHALFLATDDSSLWRYGQSLNKLVEYMLVGRPIIAVYSGFPSMINEAQCGTFVPVGDPSALAAAILHYRDMSESQREEIGLRGRTWVQENRSYDKLAQRYLNILDSL